MMLSTNLSRGVKWKCYPVIYRGAIEIVFAAQYRCTKNVSSDQEFLRDRLNNFCAKYRCTKNVSDQEFLRGDRLNNFCTKYRCTKMARIKNFFEETG